MKKWYRVLSFLLSLLMVFQPMSGMIAFAQEAEGETYVVEEAGATEPTPEPTPEPTAEPTPEPTAEPTAEPTPEPTAEPTAEPTPEPTAEPTAEPTPEPTAEPTAEPTPEPTAEPTAEPTPEPTAEPTAEPTPEPTAEPTAEPTPEPTAAPVHPYLIFSSVDGGWAVSSCDPQAEEVTVPAEWLGQPVLKIGREAFADCDKLVSVVVSNGVEEIDTRAFADCGRLKTVTLPETVGKIAGDAFNGCGKLARINAPAGSRAVAFAEAFFAPKADEEAAEGSTEPADPTGSTEPIEPSSEGGSQSGITAITVSGLTTDVGLGATITLTADVQPAGTEATLVWESGSETIATVDNGVVTGVKRGRAIITVYDAANPEVKGTFTVFVRPLTTAIALSGPTSINPETTATAQLTVTTTPSTASQILAWKSSKPEIATISETGEITVVSVPEEPTLVYFSATTTDGSNLKKSLKITFQRSITGIEISGPSEVALEKTITLKTKTTPAGASDVELKWTSSSPTIATVDANGVVTGIKRGKTTITVCDKNNTSVKDTYVVYVRPCTTAVKVTGPAKVDSAAGTTAQLTATITPSTASKNVTWKSGNSKVATISADGLITVVNAPATPTAVYFSATATDGSGKKASYKVTFQRLVTGIEITGATRIAQNKSVTLTANVLPADACNAGVTWSSSSSVITVDQNGVVTATASAKIGDTATITAKAKDGSGIVQTHEVSVQKALKISLKINRVTVDATSDDPTATLTANIWGSTTKAEVTWSSSDPTIMTVDENGVATAVGGKTGSVTITATAMDGAGATASKTVKVIANPTSIKNVGALEREMYVGTTLRLYAKPMPEYATNKKITWATSDETIATVSTQGLVTALQSGVVTITATDAMGHSVSYAVTIYDEPVSIALQDSPDSYLKLTTHTFAATLLGQDENASVKQAIVWSLIDENDTGSTITQDGLFTAGDVSRMVTVTIRAEAARNAAVYAEKTITLVPVRAELEIIPLRGGCGIGVLVGQELVLIHRWEAEDGSQPVIVWSSADPAIASVAYDAETGECTVNGIAPGSVFITVTDTLSGLTAELPLDVILPPETITVTGAPQMLVGETAALQAAILPAGAHSVLHWSSSAPEQAAVSNDGTVTISETATPGETVTITAASAIDGCESILGTWEITICAVTETMTIAEHEAYVDLNLTTEMQLELTVTPNHCMEPVWTSGDETIATVDETGLVTFLSTGTVTITAQAADGSGVKAETTITAERPEYSYKADTAGTGLCLTAYLGSATEIVIPDTILGKPVTQLGDGLFMGNTAITSVYIPQAITDIPIDAFNGCTALASVTMCNSVTIIRGAAFKGCTALTGMTVYDAQ